MNPWDVLLDEPVIPEGLELRFGVVTQANPPMVKLGRDTSPSAINTSCVVLTADDVTAQTRVVVVKNGRKLVLWSRVVYPA